MLSVGRLVVSNAFHGGRGQTPLCAAARVITRAAAEGLSLSPSPAQACHELSCLVANLQRMEQGLPCHGAVLPRHEPAIVASTAHVGAWKVGVCVLLRYL